MIKEIEKVSCIIGLREHSKRVGNLSLKLAEGINISKIECNKIFKAAKNHDIGKCFIPIEITNKPAALSKAEFAAMKKHPMYSSEFLRAKGESEEICRIAKYHHENFDGTGYPEGLSGNDIPLGSRIIRICDVFDALTNDRVYREKMHYSMALELMNQEWKLYDPLLLETFIHLMAKENKDIKKVVSFK